MTNIPGNTSTTSRISTTGQTRSSLDFQGDSDWFRIDLKAGLTYDFRLFPPLTQTAVSTPRSRQITAAAYLSDIQLGKVSAITVQGQGNALTSRR